MNIVNMLNELNRKIIEAEHTYKATHRPEDSGFLYGLQEAKNIMNKYFLESEYIK